MATKHGKSKAKPKRRKRIGQAVPHLNPRRAFQRAADALYEDDDPQQALTLLQQIETQGSMSLEVLKLYLEVLHQLRYLDDYARLANVMAERFPHDANANLFAASGALATMQPVSAILYFERFLNLAPKHPAVPTAEKELAKLRHYLPEILDAFLDELPKDLPRIAAVEKILHVFKLGCFEDVIKRAQRHLQSYPNDLRIRNNLAEALALKGDATQALRIIDETLSLAPDNFFARAVRCRLTYFKGQTEQSRTDAERLLSLKPRQISDLTKAAQSLAYIGDDDGIRWAYEQAERLGWLEEAPTDVALLTNYFASSLAFTGDTKSARSLWQRAVKLAGKATTAQENLDDARQPAGKRWGPAYFDIREWLSQTQQDDIREINSIAKLSDEWDHDTRVNEAVNETAHRFLKKHPEVVRLIPDMLERGNAACQQFAFIIACRSQHPDVKTALSAYVQGSRGTDEIRRQLLMMLKELGYTFESPLAFYTEGTEQQIEMLGFQITDEPSVPEGRSDETCELLEAANEALYEHDGAEAERLLRQVMQIEPEQPDVLNNLAAALEIQNRMAEADLLIDQVIEKHPDYFFSKIAAAGRAINRSHYDKAHEILIELQRLERLHYTEFFALAKLFVHTYVGKREPAAAQRWLEMLERYAPDHPDIPTLSRTIASSQRVCGWLKHLRNRQ